MQQQDRAPQLPRFHTAEVHLDCQKQSLSLPSPTWLQEAALAVCANNGHVGNPLAEFSKEYRIPEPLQENNRFLQENTEHCIACLGIGLREASHA